MSNEKSFGELLASHRSKFGISQEELARISGVSKNQIAKYETNKAEPRRKAIEKLSTALGITPEDLGYKTLPKSAMLGEQTEARILLGIMNLKDEYLNTILMQRTEGASFEDMIIECKNDIDKKSFFEKIEHIAKLNNVTIHLKEIDTNKYALSFKFSYLNITQ